MEYIANTPACGWSCLRRFAMAAAAKEPPIWWRHTRRNTHFGWLASENAEHNRNVPYNLS